MTGKYVTQKYKLTKKNIGDAGLDVCASELVTIPPRKHALVSTGIRLAIPENHVGLLWSRSGLSSKLGIEVGAGCIDSSYRGEIKVNIFNHGDDNFLIQPGDRIAQLLTIPIMPNLYEEVDDLDETDRGSDGFGSTGINDTQED